MDTGPVLSTASLPIAADDTTGTRTPRLAALGANLLIDTLPAHLRGDIQPQPQEDADATYALPSTKRTGRSIGPSLPDLIAQPCVSAVAFRLHDLERAAAESALRSRAAGEGRSDALPGTVIAGRAGPRAWSRAKESCGWKRCNWPGNALPVNAFAARGFIGSRLPG